MVFKSLFSSKLQAGQPAPDFKLPDQYGQEHSLSAYRGRWVVLYFYPKDFTPGCTQEACSFRDHFDEFIKKNIPILGVSADDVESHKKFSDHYKLPYPLLADPDKIVAKLYGALLPFELPNRITFLINPEGVIAERLDWVRWDTYAKTVMEHLEKLR